MEQPANFLRLYMELLSYVDEKAKEDADRDAAEIEAMRQRQGSGY